MQQLLGDKLGTADFTSFFRELFLQRLPAKVRMVLASTDSSMDLNKPAELADKVMEVAAPTVANISSTPSDSPITAGLSASSEVKQLREEVARLTELVESLATRSRRRSQASPRRAVTPVPPNPPQEWLCWYHRKYGDDAQKCKQPCTQGLNFQYGH